MKCPLGLVYRKNCIRTLSSIWNKKSTKDYVIERCKAVAGNCLPVIVIDDNDITKEAECYFINHTFDGFDEHHDKILCRRVEAIAKYSVTKYNIQKSNKSKEDKEKYVLLNERLNYNHEKLEAKDEKDFNKFVKGLQN